MARVSSHRSPRLPGPILALPAFAALTLITVVLVLAGSAGAGQLLGSTPRVGSTFVAFYRQSGGTEIFGPALTKPYRDDRGLLVQTFERAQLQVDEAGRVSLAPIAMALALGDGAASVAVDARLQPYYDSLGGEAFLGVPISPARAEQGLWVQDFAAGRLVWRGDGDVSLGRLGLAYLHAYPAGADMAALAPGRAATLRPIVTAALPSLGPGQMQTIFLYVVDSNEDPVEGVPGLAILRYGSALAEVTLAPTGPDGVARASFMAPPAQPGEQVFVEVVVVYGEGYATAQTSYIQWW